MDDEVLLLRSYAASLREGAQCVRAGTAVSPFTPEALEEDARRFEQRADQLKGRPNMDAWIEVRALELWGLLQLTPSKRDDLGEIERALRDAAARGREAEHESQLFYRP